MDADPATTLNGAERFKAFKRRVDDIGKAVSGNSEANKAWAYLACTDDCRSITLLLHYTGRLEPTARGR